MKIEVNNFNGNHNILLNMEDYADGIDTNGSLKYERTQNRDIIKTIERINRSERFKDSANDVVNIISSVLKKDSEKIFKDLWRNEHESHNNPSGLSISVDMVPPVLKKVHADGDLDTYFKPHKEYPFYYLFSIKMVARFTPSNDDPMKNNEAQYGKWFIDNILSKFSNKILIKIEESLSAKFSNIFEFPSIKNNIFDAGKHALERINIELAPILKFNVNGEEHSAYSRFDYSEEIRNVLVSSIAMAFERIVRVNHIN